VKQFKYISALMLLSVSTMAAADEAYFFVWSSCQDCCESGEGQHLYVSNVIHADDSDWDQIEGPFIRQVKVEYPKGPGGATVSAAYASESEASRARQEMVDGMGRYSSQVHEIKW